jgi:hypothetical protein
VGKKKKSKKNKPTASSFISADERTYLDSLLEGLNRINLENPHEQIPGPEFAQALLEGLPTDDPQIVPVVLTIREHFEQKNVQKAVKKVVFRLQQRGVSVPETEADTSPILVLRHSESPEPTAYLGAFDGAGNRGMLINIPQIPKGVNVSIGVVNSEEGIDQFIYLQYSKKQAKEVQELFFDQGGQVIETSMQHAASILEKAYLISKPGEATEAYLQLRPWILEHITILDHPIIHDFIPPESISEEVLTPSMVNKLLEHEFMQAWIVEPEKMAPILEAISSVEESPILVSETQKSERIQEIKDKTVADLYPDSKRLVLKDNLEETAYLFYKLGEEEYARLALLAAFSMAQNSSLTVNLFLKSLLGRSIDYYTYEMDALAESVKEEQDRSSGLIIP